MNRYDFCILFLLISFLLIPSIAYTGDLNQELEQFVLDTYRDYGVDEFEKVYDRFHPFIKEKLSKERYLQYQYNLSKYNLIIEETRVLQISEINKLPAKLSAIIPSDPVFSYYAVQIEYTAEFDTAVGRQKRDIEKDVYLAVDEEKQKIHLLWDPSVVNKEMQNS